MKKVTALEFIAGCDEVTFRRNVQETFVTKLTDRTTTELKEGGAAIPVTFENRLE